MNDFNLASLNIDLNLDDDYDIDNLEDSKAILAFAEDQSNRISSLKECFEFIEKGDVKGTAIDDKLINKDILSTLFYLTDKIKPTLTLETGFVYGLAATTFLSAHELNNRQGGHVPVADTYFFEEGDKKSADLIKGYGFDSYQVMEHPPIIVLPQLLLQEVAPDLKVVFLNSAEGFEEACVEFFYIDKMLLEHGVLAINTNKSDAYKDLVTHIKDKRFDYKAKELDCGLVLFQKKPMQQ